MPISIAVITARDMSRCGFSASPPIWIGLLEALQREHHAGRQRREDAVRAVGRETAAGGEVATRGSADDISTTTVSTGTAVFQITMACCSRPASLAPARLIDREEQHQHGGDDEAGPFRVPFVVEHDQVLLVQSVLSRYGELASTSIGAMVTACSQATQPAVKPASAPNAKCGNRAVPPATG